MNIDPNSLDIVSFVSAVSTVILAFVTWRNVALTRKNVELTQEHVILTANTLKASNTPKVIMFLVLRNNGELLLRVENMGTGYASNVKFGGDLSFQPPGSCALSDMEPFKSGIDYLGSGYRVDTLLFDIDDSRVSKHIFDIKVSYNDSANVEYKPESFRFGDWDDTSKFRTNVETVNDEIASRLEGVWVTLDDLRNVIKSLM